MDLISVLTETTCGEACWSAREDICRCSCGGKNHGCNRGADGVRPARQAKIDGVRYTLMGVGNNRDLYNQAHAINKAAGPRQTRYGLTFPWGEHDKGAPARLKYASKDQVTRWPELLAWREARQYDYPRLLWVREEIATILTQQAA